MYETSPMNKIIKFIAVFGIAGTVLFYINLSQSNMIELFHWLITILTLILIVLLSARLFRPEILIVVKHLDLLIPLFLMIPITEYIRFKFILPKHLESVNVYFSNGHLAYLPYSSQETIGLSLIFFAELLFSAWILRLIWQSVELKKTNLLQALKTLHIDWLLFLVGNLLNYGLILIVIILISFLTSNIYLFSFLLSIFCFTLNLFTVSLLPVMLKCEKNILNSFRKSLIIGWNERKTLFLPVILQTILLGICIGVPTNFFQLLSIDKSLLVESRFFLSIKDLWFGNFPSSFQWYPTLSSLVDTSPLLPFYIILSTLIFTFSIIIKLRIVNILYKHIINN